MYDDRNPAFNTYKYDCTNFVSQILWAGGIRMQHKSNNYWHSSYAYGTSDSWKLVENFYSYWNKRKQTHSSWSKSTIISHAKVGDIIQFKKRNGTRYSHAMFVYEKSGGTIYLSGHVSDILKRDFKKVDAKTYEMYRVIKM